ncbi:MAG: hypothetical protein HYZ43_10010, partial [Flavobacteriia bacterium]|nr:hypothetical protein [Flavobacteriia bacterium]
MSVFGIVLFLLIGGMAFWMLLFLLGFIVPYWIHLGVNYVRRQYLMENDVFHDGLNPTELQFLKNKLDGKADHLTAGQALLLQTNFST